VPDSRDRTDHPGQPVAQPHDALFKYVFGKPVHAASVLRAVLPAALTDRLGLTNLHPVNGSFVDEELSNRHCDVLMRTTFDGRDAYVYVLIEHQSNPDPMMPLRMLRYVMRIWDRHLENHPRAKRLPMIVPLVVYQGPRRWTHPVELGQLIDIDPDTRDPADAFLPRFRFVLDDLTKLDTAALRARPVTTPVRLTVRLLRIVPTHVDDATAAIGPDDIDDFRNLSHYPDWRELMTAFLKYIEAGSETPPRKLASLASQIGPEAEEVYMTTADMLRAEGRTEGRAEGRTEEAARLLVRLLTRRFGTVPDRARERIATASLEQLRVWSEQVLDAETLDQVLA
jgi:predicted transposase YdaD